MIFRNRLMLPMDASRPKMIPSTESNKQDQRLLLKLLASERKSRLLRQLLKSVKRIRGPRIVKSALFAMRLPIRRI